MSATFISQDCWTELTRAVNRSPGNCLVAVAYFAAGASKLLPLRKGSRLVVDASEGAVKSGQTCPDDLIKLVNAGVEVFSIANLHAKVFVVGRAAYVGSANVSNRSATQLIEAVVRIDDTHTLNLARQFVQDCCLHRLGPEALKGLRKIYQPPRTSGQKAAKGKVSGRSARPILPRLFLAQIQYTDYSETEQSVHESAIMVAKKRQRHKADYVLDSYRWRGRCPFQPKDLIIQVADEGAGKFLLAPAGEVLYLRKIRNTRVTFIYLERPALRRKPLKTAASLAGCTQKRLRKQGQVRDQQLAESMLGMWHR